MCCWPKAVLPAFFLITTVTMRSSDPTGNGAKFTLKPDNPTRVYVGENVSLEWRYNHPSDFKLVEVVFGKWTNPLHPTMKLMTVSSSGTVQVREGYESFASWKGNVTSSLAVFVIHNVKLEDKIELFGIQIEYDVHTPLIDTLHLHVVAKIKTVLPESPTILNTVKKVGNANWALRWSEVYSEGQLVTLYTVWHRAANVSNYTTAHEKAWLRENVTGFVYHKELIDDTFYMFAVTAWNKWGESLLESDKIFLVLTDYPDGTTAKIDQTIIRANTEVERSMAPSSIGVGGGSSRKAKAFPPTLIVVVTAAVCTFLVVVGLGYYTQRKCNRDKENNKRHQDRRGITAYSFTLEMDPTSEGARGTADERRSVASADTPLGMAESSLTAAQPAASVWNIEKNYNKPRTGEGSVLIEFRPEINTTSLETTPYELPSSLRTFSPHKECARSNDTSPIFMPPEDYLSPVYVNRSNSQPGIENKDSYRLCHGETQRLSPNRPKPKPKIKMFRKKVPKKLFTESLQSNPLYDKEGTTSQTCLEQPTYQIETLSTAHCNNATNQNFFLRPAVWGESPYMHVHNNRNWEVPRDHLSLFERIGDGTFGQVWKGAVLDLAGTQGWSVVAVKMLKEHSTKSDLMDLLSELDLLKKLKPHPNVIQLKGCLTKDVIRCKGWREFRPPLVLLEFVPHGDLLGYLKKSRGETDDYYNSKSAEVARKISTEQLYKFASDVARGMEFISAHQLIHRDLAARNVLVGEGLRCKITDFGMARDLGKAEIYVRRSNGVMPVKWMAVESLLTQVFTTKSDVWSYGIVLYEIFTLGGDPYEGMTGEEVFKYVANGHRLQRTSAVSPELYNLMLQCWKEDPSKRPTFRSIASWTENRAYYP